MKRSWARPEMVILSRKRSDEFILGSCKEGSGNPDLNHDSCETFDQTCTECSTD